MRLVLALGLGLGSIYAQNCPPSGRILPAGTISATLDDSSCLLSDGTAYAAYLLDLPSRGQIQIDLAANSADLILILRDGTGAKIDSGAGIHRPIEAGSYSILVNGRTPGQAGPYSLKTAFTAEPGMMCSRFPPIGLNQTVTGTLGVSGCVMPDGTPYEAYTLTTWGAGTLTVAVSSPDLTAALTIRSDDGRVVYSNDTTFMVPVSQDSEYQIVVATADKGGAYQLTTSFQPAGSETCRARKTFSDSDSDSASITSDSCFVTIAGSGDRANYNYYNFSVSAAGLVDLSAISSDFYPILNLLDDGGHVLASDAGGAGAPSGPGQSELRLQLNAGNYTVRLFSDVPSGGSYTLKYSFGSGAPQPCVPAAVNPGDTISGALSASSCRTSLGLADLYSLTLPASGTLDLDMSSIIFDPQVAIRDAKDNLIVLNHSVDGVTNPHITADLAAGAYTIVAAANSGAGYYQTTSKFTAHEIPPCAPPLPLAINGGYIWRLGASSCGGADGQPVDYYEFTLPSDGVVAAVMTSNEVDGFISIIDSTGNILRSDDNSYTGGDPLIVQYLPAGKYRVAARAASGGTGGLYRIDLLATLGPRPPFCASKGTLALGGSIAGILNYPSCQYPDGAFADIYQVNMTSDTAIDLRLNSSDFDAFLVLLDAKGNLVDDDDDSGGSTNARLVRPLSAGTYYVVAKPFGDYTKHGNYTLSLGQAQ